MRARQIENVDLMDRDHDDRRIDASQMALGQNAKSGLGFFPDGNPHRIPRMVPVQDWAPPLFSRPSAKPTSSATVSGPGPASLLKRYGAVDRSINSGVPFGKGGGWFF